MNLSQRDKPHFVRANRAEELLAIVANMLARVPVRESEIKDCFGSISTIARHFQIACATRSCTEAVNQPIEPRERRCFENLQAAGTS